MLKDIPSVKPVEEKAVVDKKAKHSMFMTDLSIDSGAKKPTPKPSVKKETGRQTEVVKAPKSKLILGLDSKKVNEYPTFIEEGRDLVNQKDKIESMPIDNLSDIPEQFEQSKIAAQTARTRANRRIGGGRSQDMKTFEV